MDRKIDITADRDLIESLGGATRLAQILNYGSGGVQRVHNWTKRGIPAAVKLDRPDLFLRGIRDTAAA